MELTQYSPSKLPIFEPDVQLIPDVKLKISFQKNPLPVEIEKAPLIPKSTEQKFDLDMNLHTYQNHGVGLKKKPIRNPNIKVGKWSREEHELFKEGLKIFGKDFGLISQHIKTRSYDQVKNHYEKS